MPSQDEMAADERILLRLDLLAEAGMRVRALVRPLAEGPVYAPGQGPPEIVGWREAGRVHVRRDLHGERARVRAAVSSRSLSTETEQEPFVWIVAPGEQALDLLSALRDAEDRYVVEWAGEPRRVTRAATTANLRLRIANGHGRSSAPGTSWSSVTAFSRAMRRSSRG